MAKNIIEEKSFSLAVETYKFVECLQDQDREYILSKQLLRCSTSIGANAAEAAGAFSKADFIFKMNIAYKECRETDYWLRLMKSIMPEYTSQIDRLQALCNDLLNMTAKSVITSKKSRP